MVTGRTIWATLGAITLLAVGCAPQLGTNIETNIETNIATAAWVVRDQLVEPANIAAVCDEARSAGLDRLVVQVRGRGDAYYETELAPRAQSLVEANATFDPLKKVLSSCYSQDLLAWLNVYYIWGGEESPPDPRHLANTNPEWIIHDADGVQVSEYSMEQRAKGWIEGLYADPASTGYRKKMAALVGQLAADYPVEGIHLDFVRYPGPAYGQGGLLGIRFTNRYGLDPRWLPAGFGTLDVRAWIMGEMGPDEAFVTSAKLIWASMRSEQVTKMVAGIRETLDSTRQGVELSAAIFPDSAAAFIEKGQDWVGWVEKGLVDALYPMAYFGTPERVSAQLQHVCATAKGINPELKLWAGLGAYIKEADQIGVEADAARQLGYDGICLFDAGTIRAKNGGMGSYTQQIEGERNGAAAKAHAFNGDRYNGDNLAYGFLRVAGDGFELPNDWPQRLEQRRAEFRAALGKEVPKVLGGLEALGVEVPPWRELSGVFRYVHPMDPEERKTEQFELCTEARDRIVSGEDVALVALEMSQGGTKSLGGWLGRKYLGGYGPMDDALEGLAAGGVSQVVEVSNGCWVYVVEKAGGRERVDYNDAPWQVRRRLFRGELSKEFKKRM